MNALEYLEIEDLLGFIRRLGIGPVCDIGMLDAAVARMRSSAFGRDAYLTIELKIEALLRSLVRNHALADGNERPGWLAAVVFLDVNGRTVELEDEDASNS